MWSKPFGIAALTLCAAACASAPKPPPPELSADQADALAAREERAAKDHAARYEVTATEVQRCTPETSSVFSPVYNACWTEDYNPTNDQLEEERAHLRAAAEYRAHSRELRDAEARACGGLSAHDRDISPFAHGADVLSVQIEGGGEVRSMGATIVLRAHPGFTAGWLQHVVDCHLARNEARAHDVPEMPYCPLVPKGASAKVTTTSDGLAVTILSDDPQGAMDIMHRALALAPRR
jgi:hypothetical protein